MSNSDLPVSSQNPILLDKWHHIAKIIVRDAHEHVLHGGVKETLTEVGSSFWLIWGRQFVHHIIHKCVISHRSEGRPYQGIPPLPLPEYLVKRSRLFQFTGMDFAGPLYVKPSSQERGPKAWLCLYTYAATGVHLDLVPNLNTLTFLSYISSDDLEEPLIPSHLLIGYTVLSFLPDPSKDIDPNYQESASLLTRTMKHAAKVSERFWR